MSGEVSGYLEEVFQQISEEYEFRIDTMEVMEDHVHIFVEVPPRYSPAQAVQILKSVSAREVFPLEAIALTPTIIPSSSPV
ncbi:IS200/IS605 family transposase, partial [Chloroflexota bacterium]